MKQLTVLLWLWAVTTRWGVERTVYEFYQPSGDRLPRPMVIRTLRAVSGDVPNSKNVDLAYPFIDSGRASLQASVPFCS